MIIDNTLVKMAEKIKSYPKINKTNVIETYLYIYIYILLRFFCSQITTSKLVLAKSGIPIDMTINAEFVLKINLQAEILICCSLMCLIY